MIASFDINTLNTKRGIDVKELFLKYINQSLTIEGPWLAGGAVRDIIMGEKTKNDYDYFFKNKGQFDEFCASLDIVGDIKKIEYENNITYKIGEQTIQAIKIKFYDNIESLLESFDFTICQFAFDGQYIYHSDLALYDLGRKRLVVNKVTYAVSSIRRLIKYARKGFYACPGAIVDLLTKINKTPESINTEVISID